MFHRLSCLRAALLAFAGLVLVTGHATAAQASQRVDFRIVIPVMLRVALLETPRAVDLPEGASTVERRDATTVQVQNNCRGGVSLAAGSADPDLERVHLEVDGERASFGAGGGVMRIPYWGTAPRALRVSYRLDYRAGSRAGARPWPVSLQFTNCA
jgi:hypothetical protein